MAGKNTTLASRAFIIITKKAPDQHEADQGLFVMLHSQRRLLPVGYTSHWRDMSSSVSNVIFTPNLPISYPRKALASDVIALPREENCPHIFICHILSPS